MCARLKEPFDYNNKEEFKVELGNWIGDVLYEILPEHGYEVREEQIYTAFQLADGMCDKKVHLAEAGLGTGKTIGYLLPAIAYARYSKKPVVIACATTALQEQLVGENGDIAKLSKILDLDIDARMAKDLSQYICDVRVNENSEDFNTMSDDLHQWIVETQTGERSEMPTIPDRIWNMINWNETMACDTCLYRGYCKLVKAKESYKTTRDLLIVDHTVFFKDLWTRNDRIADGLSPILPSYSAVIFDEGHKISLPAAMQAGEYINKEEMERIISSVEGIEGARDAFSLAALAMEQATGDFFAYLEDAIVPDEQSERLSIRLNDNLIKAANAYDQVLNQMLLEMEIEQELYSETIPISQIQAYENQIERALGALYKLCRNGGENTIHWVDQRDGSFWVVPKNFNDMLHNNLFKKDIPVIITSATLSNDGDFSYFTRSLGLKMPSRSTVGSPFDLEEQVKVLISQSSQRIEERADQGIEELVSLLSKNGGRALVLTNSIQEARKITRKLKKCQLPFEIMCEDDGERGYLVSKFKEDESSVLVGATFWEGMDVPGDALTLIAIWQLPFPSLDPLIEVRRKEAKERGFDSLLTVDYPEMGLKLKQGCGRLIRTQEDHGEIVILDAVVGTPWEKVVMGALPSGAKVSVM